MFLFFWMYRTIDMVWPLSAIKVYVMTHDNRFRYVITIVVIEISILNRLHLINSMSAVDIFKLYNYMYTLFSITNRSPAFKALRRFLQGFFVTMYKGACEQEVKSPGPQVEGLDALYAQARATCDNRLWQIRLNHEYSMTFSISPRKC